MSLIGIVAAGEPLLGRRNLDDLAPVFEGLPQPRDLRVPVGQLFPAREKGRGEVDWRSVFVCIGIGVRN